MRLHLLFPAALLGLFLAAPAGAVDAVSLEFGAGEESAQRFGVGARWDWDSRWFTDGTWHLGGYWEAGASHWRGDESPDGNDSITEVGVTPVFRLQPHAPSGGIRPYLELGIGAHLFSARSLGDKEFGTALNFGSHLGAGVRFGAREQFELDYRFQHLSNAGLEDPNLGINFHLLRFTYRY